MRTWLVAALILALASTGPARALDPPAPGDQTVSAPVTHAPTGLRFPPAIAGVPFIRSIDYARSGDDPGLGVGYTYGVPGRLLVTIYVYDLGRRAPDGHDSAIVAAAFEQSLSSIRIAATRIGKYHDLQIEPPGACGYGAVTFRCVTFTAISADGSQPLFGKLLLTGYRGYFLKLRADWRRDAPDDTDAVERVVQTFVGTALR
ncbi:MAG: hypothetical protein FJX20_03505 [Alphaproteobacteria bacterium]|nr:hypothetical protein [Alphaproteobacteria bacterium]